MPGTFQHAGPEQDGSDEYCAFDYRFLLCRKSISGNLGQQNGDEQICHSDRSGLPFQHEPQQPEENEIHPMLRRRPGQLPRTTLEKASVYCAVRVAQTYCGDDAAGRSLPRREQPCS